MTFRKTAQGSGVRLDCVAMGVSVYQDAPVEKLVELFAYSLNLDLVLLESATLDVIEAGQKVSSRSVAKGDRVVQLGFPA